MSVIKASTSEQALPVGNDDALREFEYKYTGGANNSQSGVTNGTFVVAAVGASQVVPTAVLNPNLAPVNARVQISDGTHTIIGTVTAVGTTSVTAQAVAITAGAAGNTMASAATIIQATSATFVVAAVNASQVIPLGSVAQAALFGVGDVVGVTDGTNTITVQVTAVNGANLTATTTAIGAGSAGNTMAVNALVTSTSGDLIQFAKVPAYTTLVGCIVVSDSANTGMTVSVGYQPVDGSSVTHNADLVAAATALATATRIRDNSAVAPQTPTVDSYLTMRITGGPLSKTTNLTLIPLFRYNSTP